MREYLKFYIDGQWVDPVAPRTHEVINPATEEPIARISLGGAADVDKAVKAAQKAFETWQFSTREERMEYLGKIIAVYQRRMGEVAEAISSEMGAPMWLAAAAQAPSGLGHFANTLQVLKDYKFEDVKGSTLLRYEPVGVCGFITPWNWPINQIACKVAPAIAAGCTMVLKPSELCPINAILMAEIIHEAGLPKGVFNLVNGDGPGVGETLSKHPGVDMMSFTGSTRAGILVAKAAADTVKRVTQELGGKSANIILEDADLKSAVTGGMISMTVNTGQSCNAPSRMFVPRKLHDEAAQIAKAAAESVPVGPNAEGRAMGPLANATQFQKVQALIQKGIDEGATLVTGGVGRPPGVNRGYYVRPTVFANVTNDMTIAREEIFGPVLAIQTFRTLSEVLEKANNTPYGLSGGVWTDKGAKIFKVTRGIKAGVIWANTFNKFDPASPFGGYKESGYGREGGRHGLRAYVELS